VRILHFPWLVFAGIAAALGCPASGGAQAPQAFVIPPCTAPAKMALACEAAKWADRVAGLPGLNRPGSVVPVEASLGVAPRSPAWTADAWVFGYRSGEVAALQMPGDRGLAEWGREQFPPRHWARIAIGKPREFPEARFDAGGNVLVSPPVAGRFRWGLIITSRQMQQPIKDFLKAQRAQTTPNGELVEIDTSWLKVGHVDEVVAFVPDTKRRGFRMVLPDPEAGLKLLAAVPPETALFACAQVAGRVSAAGARFLEDQHRDFGKRRPGYVRIISGKGAGLVARVKRAEGNRLVIDRVWDLRDISPALAVGAAREGRVESMPIWFDVPDSSSRYLAVESCRMWLDGGGEEFPAVISAGELAGDKSLAKAAQAIAQRIYGPGGIQGVLWRALGFDEKHTLRLPALFQSLDDGRSAAAIVPNPVNLVCLGDEVICLAPFGCGLARADAGSDVFRRAWSEAFEKLGLQAHFLDGWDSLHRLDGGARCGTNVLRLLAEP
jgi:hypothetical protein